MQLKSSTNHQGKKNNSQPISGKVGLGRKNGSDATAFVVESSRQSKDLGKKSADTSKNGMNNSRSGSINNMDANVVTSSRFAVLSEEIDDEGNVMSTRNRAGFQSKIQAKSVLAEISNRKPPSKIH
ncbi:hypothetical protein LWI29_034008 [Acer saccharum]|uniref:Uncharacterized protein n=1 Tax=Acer saccharum TaxID=4024 RepID=A0AA39W7F7_ACESA|nr:hypothetical protein LWI29_034008 [Acer saccharum]